MEVLLKQLEEERSRSSSMKDFMSVLQQQLCDAQSSAQVNLDSIVLHLVSGQVVPSVMLGYYVFLPIIFVHNQDSLSCTLSSKTHFYMTKSCVIYICLFLFIFPFPCPCWVFNSTLH